MLFSVPYFNWIYAKENGFVKWLVLGELVATGKGIIWPYYLFTKNDKENFSEHLIKSIEYSNKTATVVNKNHPFMALDVVEKKKFVDFKRDALEEGLLVNLDALNSRHPNFGNYFRDFYLKGLQILIEGYDKNNEQNVIQGFSLLDTWADWYSANLENIKTGNKIEVQLKQNNSSEEAPQMNVSELNRYSKVLKKANEENLNETDIVELRGVFKDYSERTGRKFSSEEYNYFIGTIKILDDYLYELGTSLLLTWDQKKITKTSKYDELYKTIKIQDLRKDEKLKMDIQTLKAASANQNFVEDFEGRKFSFGRNIILAQMKNNELTISNIKKISDLMKELMN